MKIMVPSWLLKLPPLPKLLPANILNVPVFVAYNHVSHETRVKEYGVAYAFNDSMCVWPYLDKREISFVSVVHKYVSHEFKIIL
jgi:hypothetical protein